MREKALDLKMVTSLPARFSLSKNNFSVKNCFLKKKNLAQLKQVDALADTNTYMRTCMHVHPRPVTRKYA